MPEDLGYKQAFEYRHDTLCYLAEFHVGEFPDDYPESVVALFCRGMVSILWEPKKAVSYFELSRGEALRRWMRELRRDEEGGR